jgi:hypothetical protein
VLCATFIPAGASACPSCGAGVVKKRSRMVGPLATIGGGVLAMTLSACYGGADDYYPPDATPDAMTDTGPDMGAGDTGSADTGSADTGAEDAAADAEADAAADAEADAAPDA